MAKQFRVIIIEYEKEKEDDIERLVKELTKRVGNQEGEVRRIYEGSDGRVISALEKILKLAE